MALTRALAAAATLLLVAAAPAAAEEDDRPFPEERPQVELFTGLLFGSGETETDLGLRFTSRRRNRWAFELGGRHFGPSSLELWIVDISAKRYLGRNPRRSPYLVGGAGYLFSGRGGGGVTLAHVGVGVDVTLGKHLFLRPDLRGRFFVEDSDAPPVGELTLGLGWRF